MWDAGDWGAVIDADDPELEIRFAAEALTMQLIPTDGAVFDADDARNDFGGGLEEHEFDALFLPEERNLPVPALSPLQWLYIGHQFDQTQIQAACWSLLHAENCDDLGKLKAFVDRLTRDLTSELAGCDVSREADPRWGSASMTIDPTIRASDGEAVIDMLTWHEHGSQYPEWGAGLCFTSLGTSRTEPTIALRYVPVPKQKNIIEPERRITLIEAAWTWLTSRGCPDAIARQLVAHVEQLRDERTKADP